MRILFAPAAGAEIGGGHVMRCLSLAAALAERGAECRFAGPEAARAIVGRFGARRFPFTAVSGWDELNAAAARARLDALVLDNYGAGACAENELRASARVLMAIDDLADREHVADILLDPSHGRAPEDYAGLAPAEADLLLGPAYALLRPGFAGRRAKAAEPVGRVFISFGLSDVGGIAGRAVSLLAPLATEARFDVALSSSAESLGMLRSMSAADPRISLHVDAADVAELMAEADLAVGAGGGGTWERACLGLPAIAVIVADNQRGLIERLGEEGALIAIDGMAAGWEAQLAAAFQRLLVDASLKRSLAQTALALCDGRGAGRAAEALLDRLSRP